MLVESSGPSLKRKRELDRETHHLRIYGVSADPPKWAVEHHASEHDKNPETHYFDDGHEMIVHVAQHAHVPESNEGEGT